MEADEDGDVIEQVSLSIPDNAAPGVYYLWTGMYNALDNQRLPALDAAGRRLPDDRVLLGQVRVLDTGG